MRSDDVFRDYVAGRLADLPRVRAVALGSTGGLIRGMDVIVSVTEEQAS